VTELEDIRFDRNMESVVYCRSRSVLTTLETGLAHGYDLLNSREMHNILVWKFMVIPSSMRPNH
jgi:hypothetical protein